MNKDANPDALRASKAVGRIYAVGFWLGNFRRVMRRRKWIGVWIKSQKSDSLAAEKFFFRRYEANAEDRHSVTQAFVVTKIFVLRWLKVGDDFKFFILRSVLNNRGRRVLTGGESRYIAEKRAEQFNRNQERPQNNHKTFVFFLLNDLKETFHYPAIKLLRIILMLRFFLFIWTSVQMNYQISV